MTVNSLIYKLTKYFSWLYFRHWERWELLIIVLISLILLLLIIWQHRKEKIRNVYVNQIRERSPIIGVKLADNRSRLKLEDSKKDRSAFLHKTSTKQKETKEQLEKLNKQIQLLQLEISKHKQNEVRLEQQVTELMTANKKLRQKAVINNQPEQSDKQQPDAVPVSDNKLQRKMSKHRDIEPKAPKWMLREKTQQAGSSKELPLDVEKLKALAALARQIRGQHQ